MKHQQGDELAPLCLGSIILKVGNQDNIWKGTAKLRKEDGMETELRLNNLIVILKQQLL